VRNPNNLKIKRVSRSDNLYAPWLPAAEEEPCPNEGKSGKTNKRISLERPTGVFDSFEAGKQAIPVGAVAATRSEVQEGASRATPWDLLW